MIEILIAVSIMVTFSTLVGAVYYKKLEEAKESFAKIDINNIMASLLLFESRNARFPLDLNELVNAGDIVLRRDPWGNEYIYIPFVDWSKIIEFLDAKKEGEAKSEIESINLLAKALTQLPFAVDPLNIICASAKTAFVFSAGNKEPIFPQDVYEITIERKKVVLNMVKLTREKAGVTLLQSINSLNV
jgi:hypothetical protein